MTTLAINADLGFYQFFSKSYGFNRIPSGSVGQNEASITFGWKNDITSDLMEISNDCSQSDWDGYEAMAVTSNEINIARKFLSMLPESIKTPEVSPDPDGAISFNWGEGHDLLFSVSPTNNLLFYAGIFPNGAKTHGQIPDYDEIPKEITIILSRFNREI